MITPKALLNNTVARPRGAPPSARIGPVRSTVQCRTTMMMANGKRSMK
jgi:hypothetical protein